MKLSVCLSEGFSVAFGKLLSVDITLINGKTIYKIKKIEKKIKEEFAAFEDFRKSTAESLSEKGEDGKGLVEDNKYVISQENTILLNQKLNEMTNVEFELPCSIDFEEIEKGDFKIKDVFILEDIIKLKE